MSFDARTTIRRLAFVDFVVLVVVLCLLPAMAMAAPILKVASVCVRLGLLLRTPDDALVLGVVEDVKLASKVLPVMGVDARVSGMRLILFIRVRAPHSFEMEEVEVDVTFHAV